MEDADFALALSLQQQYDEESDLSRIDLSLWGTSSQVKKKTKSIVDSEWELLDPNPDILVLFQEFNQSYFWGKLSMVEVKWSPRMTLCAGICSYEGHGGLCSIRLSKPLLRLRPRRDLVETLLHEMIHAYLFVTANNKDRDGHGPEFCKHMRRINQETGANITIYHSFHDEVNEMRQHWWRCQGPCQSRAPYFGYVRRAMNRAPSARDFWWNDHQKSCGGTYIKIKEPENYGQKNKKKTPDNKKDTSEKPISKINAKTNAEKNSKGIFSSAKKLGGSKVEECNGRGIPATSRLLMDQISFNTQSPKQEERKDIRPQDKSSSPEKSSGAKHASQSDDYNDVPTTSRLPTSSGSSNMQSSSKDAACSTPSSPAITPLCSNDAKENIRINIPSPSEQFSVRDAREKSKKRELVNNTLTDMWGRLSVKRKKPMDTEGRSRKRRKMSANMTKFLENLNKRGGKSVSEGAPVLKTIKPVISFSKFVIHFEDSDDDTLNDKENNDPEMTYLKRRDSPNIIGNENYVVKKEPIFNGPDLPPSEELDDWFWDGIDIDLTQTLNLDDDDELELESQIFSESSHPNICSGSGTDEPSSSFKILHGATSTNSTRFDRVNESRKRLPSISDDDDEEKTFTQLWESKKSVSNAKKFKDEESVEDLPEISFRSISHTGKSRLDLFKESKISVSPAKKNGRNDRKESKIDSGLTISHKSSKNELHEGNIQSGSLLSPIGFKENFESDIVRPPIAAPNIDPNTSQVSCPICGILCPTETINMHVDDCLSVTAINEANWD